MRQYSLRPGRVRSFISWSERSPKSPRVSRIVGVAPTVRARQGSMPSDLRGQFAQSELAGVLRQQLQSVLLADPPQPPKPEDDAEKTVYEPLAASRMGD